eukprot:CAMPEP_0113616006 /NCGR_PEP_ID=MMETSP0017_2-20120614/8006_1 /TAXON_ID=2856 /ORGANISM="Cylindrotheca closterium" /LENGTH=464 /DNA_ID=CAMNT_0000525285 /DNA_START=331 /DNA_END=1725 /DNA_ORIENTATION=+ /assembly_acc=CAM_ASM_000147
MTVDIDGITYQVDFQPNTATLIYEMSQRTIQEEPLKKKQKKKSRFGLSSSLPSKLKKKLKSRTNKKIKGKSKMAALKSAAIEPSKNLIKKWKANSSSHNKYQDLESSGSLFTGRLEDDGDINLPSIFQESCELQQEKTTAFHHHRITQNEVVEEKQKKATKKRWKRVKRFLQNKFKNTKSSQSSVADTASTTSSPTRTMVDSSNDVVAVAALRDDTEIALASAAAGDETFFSLPSTTEHPESEQSLPSSSEYKASLPPSLTLVRPPSVARQARAANFVFNGRIEVEYPSDEEDSSLSVDDSVIVSPVPCHHPPTDGSPRKKILNYKKKKTATIKTTEKAQVVVVQPTRTTVVASFRRWNVWALLLVAALGALLSVWQAWFALPQEDVSSESVASLVISGANISYYDLQAAGLGEEYYYYENNMIMTTMEDSDKEWPWDECEAPVCSMLFDENGALDCSYPTFFE